MEGATTTPARAPAPAGDLPAPALTRRPVYRWIIEHDDRWLFVGSYIVLAVVLSIWISLFWLVAVVGVHFALEWVRQRHLHPWRPGVLARVIWELKLDFALVLFSLAVTIYMDLIMGIVGIGGAARLAAQTAPRLAGWSRVIRGVLISLDDVAQVGRVVVMRRAEDCPDPAADPCQGAWGPWPHRWSWPARLTMAFAAGCIILLLAAPALTPHTSDTMLRTLAIEMHPWP